MTDFIMKMMEGWSVAAQLAVLAFLAIVCFFGLLYFFNKIMETNRGASEVALASDNPNFVPVLDLSKLYKEGLSDNFMNEMRVSNLALKVAAEEGAVTEASKKGLEGAADAKNLQQLADYFRLGSESSEKMLKVMKDRDMQKMAKFNKETLDYVSWFFCKYQDPDQELKVYEKEKELLQKYSKKRSTTLNKRIALLSLYIEVVKLLKEVKDTKEKGDDQVSVVACDLDTIPQNQ